MTSLHKSDEFEFELSPAAARKPGIFKSLGLVILAILEFVRAALPL